MSPVRPAIPTRGNFLREARQDFDDREVQDLVTGPRRGPGLTPPARQALPIERPPGIENGSPALEAWRASYLNLLLASPMPTGKVARRMVGTEIVAAAAYYELYRNVSPYPQAVRVLAEFAGGVGAQVYLSLSQDLSNEFVADYLGEAPVSPSFNKRLSDTILLKPQASLYIGAVGAVLPGATDYFRVRVWAPIEFLNSDVFPVR